MESTPSTAESTQSHRSLGWRGVTALVLLAGALGAGWAASSRIFPSAASRTGFANVKINVNAPLNAAATPGTFAVKLQLPATLIAPLPTTQVNQAQVTATAAPTRAPTAAPVEIANFNPKPAASALAGGPNPLFAPSYDPTDKRPVYVCGTDSFASYVTLLQIQVSGLDVQHGFHLGIVPLQLNDHEYALSQQDIDAALTTGAWDCNPNTVDGVASTNNGVITAIVDESAGGDGIWARDLSTIYDLKGKRIAYVAGSSSEFFARYALSVAQLDPATDAILQPFNTPDEAVNAFNAGTADAVSAWEPQLSEAGKGGGRPLVTSDQLRIIVDAIITSRKSIQERPVVVQAFHDAWFEALKYQFEHFDIAARQIAAWGNNDWSGIGTDNAAKDFGDALKQIAQADLNDNVYVLNHPEPIFNLMTASRRVWALARKVPTQPVQSLIDARFVQAAAELGNLSTSAQPINNTFSLAAAAPAQAPASVQNTVITDTVAVAAAPTVVSPSPTLVASDEAEALAVLPCRHFSFLPDSAVLTDASRRVLDLCVVPTLQQRVGTYLRIRGSAAWPGPKGSYAEGKIMEMAVGRAKAIADYLVTQKISVDRFILEGVLPPAERREIVDPVQQSEDRFVEMTLISSGR